MKKLVLFALIALGVQFSTIHSPRAATPVTAPTPAPARVNDLPIDPSDFLAFLRGDKEEEMTVECPEHAEGTSSAPCVLDYKFEGEVNDRTAKSAITFLKAADKAKPQRIIFEINTKGGSVDAGRNLIRQIEETKAPIVCVVEGEALSMGYFILQSCPVRVVTPRSVLMSHQVLFAQVAPGTIEDLKKAINILEVDSRAMAWQGQHRLKISMKEYLSKVDDKMWYFGADEAFDVGAVDCVTSGTATDARKSLENGSEMVCGKGTSKDPNPPAAPPAPTKPPSPTSPPPFSNTIIIEP